MLIKESTITLNVKDLDKAIDFYQSLGMTLKNRWGNHYAMVTAPGITIGLHPTSDNNLKGNSGNASIGFTTENFDEARKNLEIAAIKFTERKEEGGEFLHFTDPDGTALYFYNPKW
jgi:catechol 2,3-dioxygenase-like lactoylglutathione lyase family enzyme